MSTINENNVIIESAPVEGDYIRLDADDCAIFERLTFEKGLFWYEIGSEDAVPLTTERLLQMGFEISFEPTKEQKFIDMGVYLPHIEDFIKSSFRLGLNPLKGLREKFPNINWVFAYDPWGKGYNGKLPVIFCEPEGIDARI